MSEDRKFITVVCTANVCRSPMGQGLLAHALSSETNKPQGIEIISAGLSAMNGEPASENSVLAMKKVGIDISKHSSRMLTPEIVASSAAIFCMTQQHRQLIEAIYPNAPQHLRLFREFATDGNVEVPDPFGGSFDQYVQCRDSLVEAIPGMVRYLYQQIFKS